MNIINCAWVDVEGGEIRCVRCGRQRKPAAGGIKPIRVCEVNSQCVHLGAELRRVECPTCQGSVQVKVFACAARGECTLAKPIDGIACCAGCPAYQSAS